MKKKNNLSHWVKLPGFIQNSMQCLCIVLIWPILQDQVQVK